MTIATEFGGDCDDVLCVSRRVCLHHQRAGVSVSAVRHCSVNRALKERTDVLQKVGIVLALGAIGLIAW